MLRNIHRSLLLSAALLLLAGIAYSLPPVRAALKRTLAVTHQPGAQAALSKRDGNLKAKASGSVAARGARIVTEADGTSSGMQLEAVAKTDSYEAMATGQNGTTTSHTGGIACPTPTLGNYAAAAIMVGGRTTSTPDAAPSNATGLTAIAPAGFTGTLTVNPTTGAVNVVNAGPVGSYLVKVYALRNCGTPTTRTFTLTVNASTVCSAASFSSPIPYSTAGAGSVPFAVVAGDFNGDGKPDVATANSGANVGILLIDSTDSFSAPSGVNTGQSSPVAAIGAGDFNGDGNLDLATGDGVGNLSILLGDGQGGFAAAPGSPFNTSTFIFSLVVSDFNGDGKLDVAAGSFATNTVTIMLGDGSGGFSAAPSSPIAVAAQPYSLVTGDFNRDGQADLAVAHLGIQSVTIMLGDGSGGFNAASGSPISVSSDPYALTVGDFNQDNNQDLAVALFDGKSVAVLLGNGSGGLNPSPNPLLTATSKPNTIAIADFDGDGKQDLVTGSTEDKKSYVFLGQGNGNFIEAIGFPGDLDSTTNQVITADLNRDGKQDLIFVSAAAGKLIVKLSNCRATSNTTLAASSSASIYGQGVTFTATVSGPTGTPTGSVTFKEGSTTLGTGTVSAGVATFSTTLLGAGNHAITATYGGDINYHPSDSNTSGQTISKAVATVTAENKSRPYGVGNPTFTATYSGFVNNETASVLSGAPSLTTTAHPGSNLGGYPITPAAGTLSAANYSFAFVDGTLTVNKATTSTVLAASAAPASFGQPLTLTATVSSSAQTPNVANGVRQVSAGNISIPTGNVQFFDGANLLGTVALSNGSAAFTTSTLPPAAHTLTAVYAGDDKFDGSTSPAISQTVGQATPQLTLAASANPVVKKQYLTFTSAITGINGVAAPTGTITFKEGNTVLGTATINSVGRATFSTNALTTGFHTITAEYNGNTNYQSAMASALEVLVNRGLSATSITTSANPSSVGQPVTLTAKVLGTGGAPTGNVEFYAGNVLLGTVALNGQTASLTTVSLSDPNNSLTAVYKGDDQFFASTSSAINQTVLLFCAFSLSSRNVTFEPTGGTGQIQVTTRSGCDWTALSNVDWITINGGAQRSGDNTVTFTVTPLANGLARTGTLTIAAQTVTIIQAKPVAVVSAASYVGQEAAPGAIVSLFGQNLSITTDSASTLPLPTTLAGTRIKVTDSQGVSRFAPLFYVSPLQINYLIPVDTALGAATITVVNDTEAVTGAGPIQIVPVAPGLFTANSNGQDVAAAVLFRVAGDGTQTYENISQFDAQLNKYVPTPINMGPDTDQVFLLLFGTGLRNRTSLVGVTALIGNQEVEVIYAGPQGGFEGLDQVNLSIPRTLIGTGETTLMIMVDGKAVNTVRLNIQ